MERSVLVCTEGGRAQGGGRKVLTVPLKQQEVADQAPRKQHNNKINGSAKKVARSNGTANLFKNAMTGLKN